VARVIDATTDLDCVLEIVGGLRSGDPERAEQRQHVFSEHHPWPMQ
jgi:hypothetical protein